MTEYDQRNGYRAPEPRFPDRSRSDWPAELQKQRTVGGQDPAIVTQVEKSGILVLTRDGKEEAVPWDSMKWARPYLSANSMGPRPNGPADGVKVGDLIRVERQGDGSLKFSPIPKAQSAPGFLDPQDGAIRALVGGVSF